MTDRRTFSIRTAAIGAGIVVVVGTGAAFAVDPFPAAADDPGERLQHLELREQALARRAEAVNQRSARLWDSYRVRLAARERQIARIQAANARVRAADARAAVAAVEARSAATGARAAAPAVTYTPATPVVSSGSS